jgi:hypothetical protein
MPICRGLALALLGGAFAGCNLEVIDVTDYRPPKVEDDGLVDDRLEDKRTAFDAQLIDRRPLEDWQINQSEAVIRLDVPLAKPDEDTALLALRPSYAAALQSARQARSWMATLPSVNLLDGKAKQFDDGLYAAIDQAYFQGLSGKLQSHIALVQRLVAAVKPNSPAAPYLAAGLTLAGKDTPVANIAKRDEYVRQFNANAIRSKPIGFYTWNDTLRHCWAFLRFFQQSLKESDPVVAAIVQALTDDAALAADCQRAAEFYGKLTNPLVQLTVADLVGVDLTSAEQLDQLRKTKGIRGRGVCLFPPSSSRETELFGRLFPLGIPADANLMKELVRRIRSGEVDLSPRQDSGWYDYQVYALETMLLPERGEEHDKLLLTRPYKKRMLEAFAALITKRRETHVRQGAAAKAQEAPQELREVRPRLRVEPCPSYFVRTARSYAFLHELLSATLGNEALGQLHGLRQEGQRAPDVATELTAMRDLFYGLYLVCCEDIGHKAELKEGEVADPDRCYDAALEWLNKLGDDPDLAQDTRVAVPIYVDPLRNKMRLWATLGVRLTQLDARYVRPPRIKPAIGEGDWQTVEESKLHDASALIAVDEFAEVEVSGLAPPNRDELRKLCDKHKTKDAIVAALAAGKW